MKELNLIRQGDVMLRRVSELPSNATEQKPENGKHILALGEVTGHHHRFDDIENVHAFVANDNGRYHRFFVIEGTTALLDHEEHTPIEVPAGIWEQIYQYETTDDDEPVPVID